MLEHLRKSQTLRAVGTSRNQEIRPKIRGLDGYVTIKEVRNGALDDNEYGCEDENDVTTDTSNDSEPDFDSLDADAFDPILRADFDTADEFMDVD
jgi:hypothetical protein